jgi:putative oxidoreductase
MIIGLFRFADVVETSDVKWIIPTRIVMGLLLAFPIGGGVEQLLPWCNADVPESALSTLLLPICIIFRGIELLCAMAFILGFLLRLGALPSLLIFGLRVISNVGNSIFPDSGTVLGFIRLGGDWAYGAIYFAALVLTYDLLLIGSGGRSIDLWLWKTFASPRERSK